MYTIVKGNVPGRSNINNDVIKTVLSQLLGEKDLKLDDVNSDQGTESLTTHIRRMLADIKLANRKGGLSVKKKLGQWKDSKVNVKLGGAKWQLEEELSRARKETKKIK